MAKPHPTAERIRELLHYDPETGVFTWRDTGRRGSGKRAGTLMRGYVRIGVDGHIFLAHRLAFILVAGQVPAMVDHANGIKSDNRWANLRPADYAENAMNRGLTKRNTSGLKGVSWHARDQRWRAYICVNGRDAHLGYFQTAELAHEAYRTAAARQYGEFANFGENDNAPRTSRELAS